MLCFQCEQTVKPTSGCRIVGVCTKTPLQACLQDLLLYGCACGPTVPPRRFARFVFACLTNTNHNEGELRVLLGQLREYVEDARFEEFYQKIVVDNKPTNAIGPVYYFKSNKDGDVASLAQFGMHGVKGACAYADHVYRLIEYMKLPSDEIDSAVSRVQLLLHYYCFGANGESLEQCFEKVLELGSVNLEITRLLDKYNVEVGGCPELTEVIARPRVGKCILVSGHDLADMKSLLLATEGTGINVYTHGEMLPALSYPELKQFNHLAGHFGHAWQLQQKELQHFPGPILFTTNCIMRPRPEYAARCFATGAVGYGGVRRVENDAWGPLIQCALESPGFENEAQIAAALQAIGAGQVHGRAGLNHRTFAQYQDTITELLRTKQITEIKFIGGCDGANTKRNIFTKVAERSAPSELILTAACGRFRVNQLELGSIGGIPRLLDMGQCNDVYSAIVILGNLANTLGVQLNELPVSYYVSWYEQKAVVQLLTMLSLGIRGVRIGPTGPLALTSTVLQLLRAKYDLNVLCADE